MSDTFPNPEKLEESVWISSSYEERLQIVLRYSENFVLLNRDLKNSIFIFLTDELLIYDLVLNLRNNKAFRNLFRDILDYLFSPLEDFIEFEDTYNKYTELWVILTKLRYTAHLDPQDKIPSILMESKKRHTWNSFGITPEVIQDFEDLNISGYDYTYFDKFRLLAKWLLLDLLNYYDSLDTVGA